ncbi:MAG: hypothetical protein WB802_11570 [Candidatus Dormiibacterota bacterium]
MGEDEQRLRQSLRAERPAPADLQAIDRVRDGLTRRTFLSGGRARGLRMLASSLVFAVAALVVAGVLLAPRLGQAGGVGQAGPVRQVGQAAPSDSTSASPPSASTAPGTATYPATFVAVVDGGLELVDSTTGAVVRTLAAAPEGDDAGDYSPTLTSDGATVFFTESAGGSCGTAGSSEAILSVPTAGGTTSVVERTPAQAADLAPAVSGDGRMLAWLRESCRKQPEAIEVRNLITGAQRAIPMAADAELDSLAWAPDDVHLMVVWVAGAPENVTILDTATAASAADGTSLEMQLCPDAWPRYLPNGTVVALACPPSASTSPQPSLCGLPCLTSPAASPEVAVFDAATGAELRVLQTLPMIGAQYEGELLSSFAFSPGGASAIWTELTSPSGADVWRWSGGEVVQVPFSAPEGVAW